MAGSFQQFDHSGRVGSQSDTQSIPVVQVGPGDRINTHKLTYWTYIYRRNRQVHIPAEWTGRVGEANTFTSGIETDLQSGCNYRGCRRLPHYYTTSHVITRLL